MAEKIIRGIIHSCEATTRYDDDGNAYKDYSFSISHQKFSAKTADDFYLANGMEVILGLKEGSSSEVASGYCVKQGTKWGSNPNALKQGLSPADAFTFMQGRVSEKRKRVEKTYDNREWYSNRVGYDVYLGDKDFHAAYHFGEHLKPGMEIAVVLLDKDAVLVMDKGTGKMRGADKPYFLLLILMLLAFNATMLYLYLSHQTERLNFKMVLIVLNVFLVLFTALSIVTYRKSRQARAFLRSNLDDSGAKGY